MRSPFLICTSVLCGFLFSGLLSSVGEAAGLIPGTYPVSVDTELEIKGVVTVNGNTVALGKTGPAAIVTIDGTRDLVAQTLPALEPPSFPGNSSGVDANAGDGPFTSEVAVFYNKITLQPNTITTFSGGGPFHIKELIVQDGATVILEQGVYFVSKLDVGHTGSQLIVGSAPSIVHVGTEVKAAGLNDRMNADGAVTDLRIYLHDNAEFKGGKGLIFTGLLYGPGAKQVELKENVTFHGAILIGGKSKIENAVSLTYTPFDQNAVSAINTADVGGESNTPPVAEVGPEQTVSLNATVQLDGSGSTDADGNPLSFSWALVTTPLNSNATLSDTSAVSPTFVVDIQGVYGIGLVVNDGTVDSAPDFTVIRVGDTIPPVVTPPADLTIESTETGGIPTNHPAIQTFLSAATAIDDTDGTVPVTATPLSFFSVGVTSVLFLAQDAAGNEGFGTSTVTVTGPIPQAPPQLSITTPVDFDLVLSESIAVSGIIDDPTSTVVVNGVVATVTDDVFVAQDVPVNEGLNTLVATATNTAGSSNQAQIQVHRVISPTLVITSPGNLSVTNQTTVTVNGTVDPPGTMVMVNGVPATVSGSTFTAGNIPVTAGTTVLTAEGTTPAGSVGTASIQVVHDTTPPQVSILTPPNGLRTTSATIPVAGIIHDLTVGTVNGTQAQVVVNGVPTVVNNREFLTDSIPLAIGGNTVTALGTDQAGNTAMATVTVHREASAGRRHLLVNASNGQTGPVLTALAQPLVVQVNDETGAPLVGHDVIFRITRNNGQLSDGGPQARQLLVTTDGQGVAQATWTLGSRAGAGTNQVEVSAVGIQDKVLLTASGVGGPPTNLYKEGGDHQRGATLQALPKPFVVVVTDSEGNRIENVPVTFSRVRGNAHFNGQPVTVVPTDSDGRAMAVPILGLGEGIENQAIEATFPTNAGPPVTFVASGLIPGDPAQTELSGVVLDNSDEPIAGVTVRVDGTALETQTDAQGQFVLTSVPVGLVGLEIDGTTAQRPGTWASLHFELVTIAGRDNHVGMPIYLLPLDLPSGLAVSPTTGGTLTLPHLPGFAMTVAPGSATFPDGSQTGTISVTVVHADKVPMTPNVANQPRLVVTIQPPGVHLDPPAPISFPNTEGLPPGSILDFYSFDHDQGRFVAVGTVTVSTDGLVVQSDPGMGIVKGGWQWPPPPPPPEKGDAVTFTVALHDIDPVVLKKTAGPESPLQEKTFIVMAAGAPTTENTDFMFEVVDDNGGPVKAEFIEQVEDCKGQPVCQARFKAISPGKPKIKVSFASAEPAEKEVVIGAEVEIQVTAFIPYDFVSPQLLIPRPDGPMGEFARVRFQGDGVDRVFNINDPRFRVRHAMKIRTEDSPTEVENGPPEKNLTIAHEVSGLMGTVFTGRSWELPVDLSQVQAFAQRVGENHVFVEFRAKATNPLPQPEFLTPSLDWCYGIDIKIKEDGTGTYEFTGASGNDFFPAYEVYINDKRAIEAFPSANFAPLVVGDCHKSVDNPTGEFTP